MVHERRERGLNWAATACVGRREAVLKRNVVEMQELSCVELWCEGETIVQGSRTLRQELPSTYLR